MVKLAVYLLICDKLISIIHGLLLIASLYFALIDGAVAVRWTITHLYYSSLNNFYAINLLSN